MKTTTPQSQKKIESLLLDLWEFDIQPHIADNSNEGITNTVYKESNSVATSICNWMELSLGFRFNESKS